ncbi:MarR family transcriptional regulator [Paenibacillus sp. PK4536]|uniref:MarR family winged helix-turn-helix transcriptional regulator n=1 Tax=unclassified Paenibacillus TaxID=185978 RepID=UPI0010C144ED|nr:MULTISPECIES: MarR family transcriptional regulator [unclassified Paenibacillus]TKJ86251.1 MarR family transcriptional regulator [Paenibacillus sp. CFBP13512]WIM40963.1 MarR family transcriptional regulator [Paenibacillus sp. PK4536]
MTKQHSTSDFPEKIDYTTMCACLNFRKASRFITSLYDEYLRPVGIRATQLSLLMALEQTGSVTITSLAEVLLMDRTTLPRDLKPLERNGWVSITEGKDRRKRFIALTPEGKELLDRALPLWEQAQTRVQDYMGETRYTGLLGQLSDIVKLNREN